jgi:hypothetical protein
MTPVRRHHHALARLAGIAAHIQAHAQAGEGRHLSHQLRDAPRLVGGQRIHRVDHQRLDAGPRRLARARAQWSSTGNRKHSVLPLPVPVATSVLAAIVLAGQALPRLLLVAVAGCSVWKLGRTAARPSPARKAGPPAHKAP